jgi:hypothetical protein
MDVELYFEIRQEEINYHMARSSVMQGRKYSGDRHPSGLLTAQEAARQWLDKKDDKLTSWPCIHQKHTECSLTDCSCQCHKSSRDALKNLSVHCQLDVHADCLAKDACECSCHTFDRRVLAVKEGKAKVSNYISRHCKDRLDCGSCKSSAYCGCDCHTESQSGPLKVKITKGRVISGNCYMDNHEDCEETDCNCNCHDSKEKDCSLACMVKAHDECNQKWCQCACHAKKKALKFSWHCGELQCGSCSGFVSREGGMECDCPCHTGQDKSDSSAASKTLACEQGYCEYCAGNLVDCTCTCHDKAEPHRKMSDISEECWTNCHTDCQETSSSCDCSCHRLNEAKAAIEKLRPVELVSYCCAIGKCEDCKGTEETGLTCECDCHGNLEKCLADRAQILGGASMLRRSNKQKSLQITSECLNNDCLSCDDLLESGAPCSCDCHDPDDSRLPWTQLGSKSQEQPTVKAESANCLAGKHWACESSCPCTCHQTQD